MKYQVRTLDEEALRAAADELAAHAHAFHPDLLLGIRTGGYIVAELMEPRLQASVLPMTCRRPGTRKKEKSPLLKTLLRYLPYTIADRLRVIEHRRMLQRPPQPGAFTPDASELGELQSYIRERPGAKILIVDDAVDSGATLRAVIETVRATAPDSPLMTAAITVTAPHPLVQPDITLYRHVLCRFPWSLDFKR